MAWPFCKALSPNIFPNLPSQLRATSTKNKRILVPPNHINISSTTSTPSKNSSPTTSSLPSSTSNPRPPNNTPTKQDDSWYSLHVVINKYLSYTTTTPTPYTPNFSRTNRPWRSLQPGLHAMNTYNNTVHPPLSTSSTTSAPTPCRNPSTSTTLTSRFSPCTPTAETPPNVRSTHSKIIFAPNSPLANPNFSPKNGFVSFPNP